ncbi:hypothetical protein BH11VER1_BH11VER1_39710 [soil metagenome]
MKWIPLPISLSLAALTGVMLYQTMAAGESRRPLPTLQQALGDVSSLPAVQQAAYDVDPAFFQLISKPGPGDWLANQPEPGQTVDEYRAVLPKLKPADTQRVLCLLPLGDFGKDSPSLEVLRSYCQAFFGMETRVLEPVPIDKVPATKRINRQTQKQQLKTVDILRWLPAHKPIDTYALIAVTMEDLYPDEKWNFVFGQALLQGGVGVFSFARYDPAFFGLAPEANDRELMLRRSCKVLSHEMGHMFGLYHCVFYECIMNGSNHLGETDARPMHLCPVCLRKLQLGTGFDLLSRGRDLLKFYEAQSLTPEAEWVRRRVEKLSKAK